MNALELFHQDGRSAGVHYCAECRHVSKTKEIADACCLPLSCTRCGVDVPRKNFRTVCHPCEEIKQAEREATRFAAAEKVTDWDGWIYCDSPQGNNDGYYRDVGDLEDYIACETPDAETLATMDEEERAGLLVLPPYVWTCDPEQFASVSFHALMERINDNSYDEFDIDTLRGMDELEAACKAFNTLNAGTCSWGPNYKRALLLG